MPSLLRHKERSVVLWGVVLLLALCFGIACVAFGPSVIAAFPGLVAAVAILTQPLLGLVALLFPIPFEDALLLGGLGTITKLIGGVVAGLWFGHKVLRGESWRQALSVPLVVVGIVFIAYAGTSYIWAEHTRGFAMGIVRLVMALVLALLTIDVVRKWSHVEWLARALVLGGLVAALLVLSQYFGADVRRAGEEIAGGINATSLVLVMLLPFGFLLLRAEKTLAWRLVGLTYVALALLSIAVTFSRMSFLLVPVILIAEVWETLRGGRGRMAFSVLALVAVVGIIRFVPLDSVSERISTIGPYIENSLSVGATGEQAAMSGRGYHLYVAFRIFQDHPLFGVGYGNYGDHFLQYQLDVPGADRFYSTPRSPHSSFAGILAELGIIGMALWVALLGTCLSCLIHAWKRTRIDRTSLEFLAVRAVSLAFLLLIPYGFYDEMQDEKLFWIVLALSVIVSQLSEDQTEGEKERETGIESADSTFGTLSPVHPSYSGRRAKRATQTTGRDPD